ncbi:MAG: DNA gyrase subunit A [Patescibacteria group bacterium]
MGERKKHEPTPAASTGARIEPQEITDELRESYLQYAMSVIVSRALPDVRDGLKPVQRRILWAMWDTGLTHGAKFKKSANVVGEVLGKYHPHGDAAVYDALARMAQDFSLRYPLVDGQGNWGSVDGDAPAAMRYTEARLTKAAEEALEDIEKETVDWQPNYDSSRLEPRYLPARLPNLLLNGTVGIAVGMATSIPPHHLGEVVDATVYLAEHPDTNVQDLMRFIKGPDFPTGGVIYDRKAIEDAYRTGRGSITTRAVAAIEERKAGSYQIVISEIPYQVNKSDLLEKIAGLVQDKKIEGIRDLRDESDREGLRIVVELKSDAVPQKVVNQLYEYTELQKNFYFNMLALVDGLQPQILSLKEVLAAYLEHRTLVVRRRTEFDLKKAEERAHILTGLVKALDEIDKVIATIKKSRDRAAAHANLVEKFKFTAVQADAILEMKLQTLAGLEREKLEAELKEKKKLIEELRLILKHPKKIVEVIVKELAALKTAFPDARRTAVVASGLTEFREEDLVANEEIIVTLSEDGYIKRMPPTAFRAQRRGGKGLIGFELKDEDRIHQLISASTHDNCLFVTDRGRVFQTKAYEIPIAARTAKGKLVHNFLEIPPDERVAAVVAYRKDAVGFLVMVTRGGLVKKTLLKDFGNVRRTGIIALKLKPDDRLVWVTPSSGSDEVLVCTASGQAIRFPERDVRPMGRTAAGIKAIRLRRGDSVAGAGIIRKADKSTTRERVLTVMANGFAKQTPLAEYKTQRRGGGGIRTAKVTEKTGPVIATHTVTDETEEVIAFTARGQAIRTHLKDIRTGGRATQGVRIMKIEKGDSLVGIVCL